MTALEAEREILADVYRHDLVGFCEHVIPFGQPGVWQAWQGLWPVQREWLQAISDEMREKQWGLSYPDGTTPRRPPILRAIAACTNCGKTSILLPTVMTHAMLCFPHLRGLATSASKEHAKDKLFDAVANFVRSSEILRRQIGIALTDCEVYVHEVRETTNMVWRTALESRPTGLGGTHGQSGWALSVGDEYQSQSAKTHNAMSGIRDDPQGMAVIAGNPEYSHGPLYECTEGDLCEMWHGTHISRYDRPGNDTPELREQWSKEYGGEDSAGYRTYVLGMAPLEGHSSFIPIADVEAAMDDTVRPLQDEHERSLVPEDQPVVCGIDLAREGKDFNCAAYCAGIDQRDIPIEKIRGNELPPGERVDWVIAQHNRITKYGKPCVTYYDKTGLDGMFALAIQREGYASQIRGVNFGASDPSKHYKNIRCALWGGFRNWLAGGGCLPRDMNLRRLILLATSRVEGSRIQITRKDQQKKIMPIGPFDELDARMLASLAPSPDDILRARPPARHAPAYGVGGAGIPSRGSYMGV